MGIINCVTIYNLRSERIEETKKRTCRPLGFGFGGSVFSSQNSFGRRDTSDSYGWCNRDDRIK